MFIRLFYSTKCNECMNLWQVIQNENIVKMFIPVCLDNYTSKQVSGLKQMGINVVPTIVISAENQPTAIFEGPVKCSQWLNNFTLNRRKNMIQYVEQQRRLIQKEHSNFRNQENGALEYAEAEMEGVSDNYAYNNTELSHPKNFMMIGEENNSFIHTPQVVEGKVDIDTMKKRLAELEANRNADNQQMMKIMEQNQIKAVLNPNM